MHAGHNFGEAEQSVHKKPDRHTFLVRTSTQLKHSIKNVNVQAALTL